MAAIKRTTKGPIIRTTRQLDFRQPAKRATQPPRGQERRSITPGFQSPTAMRKGSARPVTRIRATTQSFNARDAMETITRPISITRMLADMCTTALIATRAIHRGAGIKERAVISAASSLDRANENCDSHSSGTCDAGIRAGACAEPCGSA